MKKLLSVLLVTALVLAALPLTALPALAAISGDFEYEVLSETDKTCRITDYTGSATVLTIPSKLDGYTVTSIGWDAFRDCASLTSIIIPDSVTSICSEAFYNTAYYNDASHWENDVLYIGNHLIEAKNTLSGAYTVKAGTKTIADDAFSYCTSLKSITLPDSVTRIGEYAFSNCTSLTSVTIPDSVTSIGNGTFSGCTALTSITLPDSVTSIGYEAFRYCTALTSITIPDSVTRIGDGAFSICTALTSITLPDSVTRIGEYAFSNCTALTNVTIPDSVTEIDYMAFADCTSLTSITIPDSVTSIGYGAFYGCTSLTSVTIPDSVTRIGDEAFYNTAYYNDASHWENDVLYIGNHLIKANTTLSGAYTVKAGTKTIADYAFYGCTSLKSVTIPDSVTSIGYEAFRYCTSLTSITIPDSVTEIGWYAFYECTSLTSITISDSVTSIGGGTFSGCTSLTSITIPDSVTSIGYSAFSGCTSLTSITLPDSVASIGNYAFRDSGLETIYGYTDSYAETFASKNGYTFVALQKLTDAETGVFVGEGSFGNFAENTVLNVEKLSAEENAITYDITLTVNGEIAQPASAVTVKIPVPEAMDGAQCKVYRQETNGSYTDMQATYQNGYMVFTTDHFSTYVVTTEKLDAPSYALGDLNGDDKINAVDARWVLQAASGVRELTDAQKVAADVNGDGKVNAVDARWILQVASGARTL